MEKFDQWLSDAEDAMETFRSARRDAAQLSREVEQCGRARTTLRKKLAADLVTAGTSKTAATDQARLSPEYVQACSVVEGKQEEWEIAMAEAEYFRMRFELLTMRVRNAYEDGNRLAELKGMASIMEKRIKELGG